LDKLNTEQNREPDENKNSANSFSLDTILSLFTKTYTVKLQGWVILLVIALLLVLIAD
jgi:hypothetical protein